MPSLLCSGSDFGFDPVWPELQILTLSRTTIESHLLSSVVQHRSRIGLPLQRVRIERGENWRALFDDWPLDVPTTLEFLG
ncbi:hypothetical protein JAAARDRAFT_54900 [Jaapia argillacea MUCL 33604]|uniref:Uncharacterized protein n=1 Tax=Jaapia argillacea MUCL 33604 TaxID=933084 RepID=A0A067QG06_9AGAM|nr:hypothetical protein JAAARDRAFT_54900 [Jaapia argillacea MUCL 33604]